MEAVAFIWVGMPGAIRRANNAKSKIRSKVEHAFTEQRTGWACSSAPSASPGQKLKSDWQTSSTTSNDCCDASPWHSARPQHLLRQKPTSKPINRPISRTQQLIEASRSIEAGGWHSKTLGGGASEPNQARSEVSDCAGARRCPPICPQLNELRTVTPSSSTTGFDPGCVKTRPCS